MFSPYTETTQTGNITRSIPQEIYYESSLNVMPQINGDNSITLTMQPQISDQSGIARSPDGQELPKTTTQYLSTARRVMNGETIVVGGFIKKNDNASGTKVPILGDLPLIGRLFRTDYDIKQVHGNADIHYSEHRGREVFRTAIGVVSPYSDVRAARARVAPDTGCSERLMAASRFPGQAAFVIRPRPQLYFVAGSAVLAPLDRSGGDI